jgi:zinc and cadmium transporter
MMGSMFIGILGLALPILIFGGIAGVINIRSSNLRLLLAFSAAYLFGIALMHLLPEVYQLPNTKWVGLFIVIGFCIQLIIESFSSGIEHGHSHLHSDTCKSHLPYGIIIGLCLHSFLEGLPVYQLPNANESDVLYDKQLVLGLALHNIPISIAFVALLKEHRTTIMRMILMVGVFALMSPLGYLTGYAVHVNGLQNWEVYNHFAFALVIGIFLHISTAIMFESGEHHKYEWIKIAMLVLGIGLAFLMS